MKGLGLLGQSLEFCAYGVGCFPPHAGHELGNVALMAAGLAGLDGRHVLEGMCAVEDPRVRWPGCLGVLRGHWGECWW